MYDSSKLQVSMAGSGTPYRALSDLRKQIIRARHDGHSLEDIQAMFSLSDDELAAELQPLVAASLLDANHMPTFFVADGEETQRAIDHAESIGRQLFEQLQSDWDALDGAYRRLKISQNRSFREMAFILVGASILDIGLLRCLREDATLLPAPPHRPSPDNPNAHYYFWMIEGDEACGGRYGQNSMQLSHPGWDFFTFGQYFIGDQFNNARRAFEEQVLNADVPSATDLAAGFEIPLIDAEDDAVWMPLVREESQRLLAVYKENEASLRNLYDNPAAHGFAEFFCWYDHVAYAHAIDFLDTHDMITIPTSRFDAIIWQGSMGW